MSDKKKLFLIDSYALIFRSYYAFINNPMRNAKGMNTSTVFGFTLALDELIRKESPTHIIAAFDASGPTFRHDMYKEYKANRDATPEDIKESVPWVKKLLEAYHIPIIEKQGYEADDIIGTLAKWAEKEDFEVYMVTPDKDFAQLVSERIFMYKPGRAGNPPEIMGVEQVKEKFNVENPEQVIDILALWGDSSDNIPGAQGIGEKTAKKLIGSFGSVEGVFEHIDTLKGKQRENLENSKENVEISKTLARIITDVPVDFNMEEAVFSTVDKKNLSTLFDALDFKNLKTRIIGNEEESKISETGAQGSLFEHSLQDQTVDATAFDTIDTAEHTYTLVSSKKDIDVLFESLKKCEAFCFDTETTGLDVMSAELVGISFSWKQNEAFYMDISASEYTIQQLADLLNGLFSNENRIVVGQNLKYDMHILKNHNIEIRSKLFDTMVAHYLVSPEKKHGIDAIAEDYLGYRKIKTESLIGKKGKQQLNFQDIDVTRVKDYACEDADITWQVYERLKQEVKERKLEYLVENIEMPLVRVLMEMEHNGVVIDNDALSEFASELRDELIGIEEKIYEYAGTEFNVSSPKQLGEILFEKLKIDKDARKTKSKQYSTAEDVLVNLVDKHPIVKEVLDFRSLKKLLSTYVEALPKLINEKTNRIHTSFNQTLVATGRLSSNNPNLQNIPIREERGREIRKAFVASSGKHRFLSADYSQIELRLMAHLSRDENMIRAFINNEDIHTATASKVYNTDPSSVTKDQRSKAKTANFGIIYGISAFGLSQRMRIPRSEAKELIDGYFNTYPGVRKYMDDCIEKARQNGYVETMFGRRRSLPNILSRNSLIRGNAERNAINTPIQGTAADIIKIAMVKIHDAFMKKGLEAKMIIQVHDELNFDVPENELEQVKIIVRESMEQAVDLSVPLIVDMNDGNNWLEAH